MDHAFVNAATELEVLASPIAFDSRPGLAGFDLRAALREVLGGYRPGSLVSTGALSERVRRLVPLLDISEADLSNAIGEQALNTGHAILFEAPK